MHLGKFYFWQKCDLSYMKVYSKYETAKIRLYQCPLFVCRSQGTQFQALFITLIQIPETNTLILHLLIPHVFLISWSHHKLVNNVKFSGNLKFWLARSLNICSSQRPQLQRISSFCTQTPSIGIEGLQKASVRALFVDVTLFKVSLFRPWPGHVGNEFSSNIWCRCGETYIT